MDHTPHPYVHGRSDREAERLHYQASKLAELLHQGIHYPRGDLVLEAACGVGAQTVILARNNPEARIVSVDIYPESLVIAKERVVEGGISNVTFCQADVYHLPFGLNTFNHVFVCFLLEHLPHPLLALQQLKEVLQPGGTITVIEGDHGSTLFYPESERAQLVIQSLIDLQRLMGGNSLIGRELFPLVKRAGFSSVRVVPCQVYADESRPEYGEGVKKIFIAMIEGVRKQVLARDLIDEETWEIGISDLYRTAGPGGVFSYTFFKASAEKTE